MENCSGSVLDHVEGPGRNRLCFQQETDRQSSAGEPAIFQTTSVAHLRRKDQPCVFVFPPANNTTPKPDHVVSRSEMNSRLENVLDFGKRDTGGLPFGNQARRCYSEKDESEKRAILPDSGVAFEAGEESLKGRDDTDGKNDELKVDVSALQCFRRRNPEFGSAKSPKSYWLRRHSDSVVALSKSSSNAAESEREESSSTVDSANDSSAASSKAESDCLVREDSSVSSADCLAQEQVQGEVGPGQRYQSTVIDVMSSADTDDVFTEDDSPQQLDLRVKTESSWLNYEVDRYRWRDEMWRTTSEDEQSPPGNSFRCFGRSSLGNASDLADIDEEQHCPSPPRISYSEDRYEAFHTNRVRDYSLPLESGMRKYDIDDRECYPVSLKEEDHAMDEGRELWKCLPSDLEDDGKLSDDGRFTSFKDPYVPRRRLTGASSNVVDRAPADESGTSGTAVTSKVHRCPVCRRSFSRSDMLERHARLHTGVRPYACRLCAQVFSRSDHLTTHLRTHTGEKPYSCPRCAYSASRRDMVTRHLRVHTTDSSESGPVGGVLGPARRRTYRNRYKDRILVVPNHHSDRLTGKEDRAVLPAAMTSSSSRFDWTSPGRQEDVRRSPSLGTSAAAVRNWNRLSLSSILNGFELDDELRGPVVARGSTGSTDSYSSPSCVSGEVFEFGAENSPDVFRSPSARQSLKFLWPFTAASMTAAAVSESTVVDP